MQKCLDCNENNHQVRRTGSLLCEDCYNKMIKEYQARFERRNEEMPKSDHKQRLEEAKELLRDTDMPVVDIARKLDLPVKNLYYHSSQIRGTRNNRKKAEVSNNADSAKGLERLKTKYDQLKVEYEELKQKLEEVKVSRDRLRIQFAELDDDYEEKHRKLTELKVENASLKQRIPHQGDAFKAKYMHEKEKHDALLKYLSLSLQRQESLDG